MRRRAILPLVAVLGAAAAGACTEVTTDPQAPVSLAFDSLPAPSIVPGDTLRDVDGVASPLTATAFNVDGDPIAGAPITFTLVPPDSTPASRAALSVTPEGFVLAVDTARPSGSAYRVLAQVGNLQSRSTTRTTLTVVPRPDSLEVQAPTGNDTLLLYNATDSTSSGRRAVSVRVRLLHDSLGAAPVPVGPYLVRFEVVADSAAGAVLDSVRFIRESRREVTTVVATGTDGVATARLQAFPRANATAPDSIVLRASARRRLSPDAVGDVRASPVRLVVRVAPGPV